MKKLSKQQLAIVIVSFISVLILAFEVITIDSSTDDKRQATKYKSTHDSIAFTDSSIINFSKDQVLNKKDIFNFKTVKSRRTQTSKTDTTKVVKTKWIASSTLDLFGKNKISFSLFFSGKARFTINGKSQEVKVGDVLTVGNSVLREVVEGTNEPTGNVKIGKEYSNKVLVITDRAVYVDCEDKEKVIRFRLNSDATYFARNLMNTSGGDEKDTPTESNETPGRRPRGGGPR